MATDKRPQSLSILRIYGGIDNWTDVHKQIESIPDLRTMSESVDIGLTYTKVVVRLLADQEREWQKIRRSGAGRGFGGLSGTGRESGRHRTNPGAMD